MSELRDQTNLTLTIVGPMYDIQCPVCGESICDGEFAGSPADARNGARQHAETHGDRVNLHIELHALPNAFLPEYQRPEYTK